MQRLLQFMLQNDNQTFKLRILEIKRDKAYRGRIDPYLIKYLSIDQSIFDWLRKQYILFNHLRMDEEQADDNSGAELNPIIPECTGLTFADDKDHEHEYSYTYKTYSLATNEHELMMFLGMVDTALRTTLNKLENKIVGVEFISEPSYIPPTAEICCTALTLTKTNPPRPATTLSRFIAEWMVKQLVATEQSANLHQALIHRLQGYLDDACPSLTPAIRKDLYPPKPVSALLARHCPHADELTKKLLNSDLTLTERNEALLKFVALKLRNKTDTQMIATHGDNKRAIHTELKAWFEQFNQQRQHLWSALVETLYGRIANDGGPYAPKYTEIVLLKEARLVLNLNGLMELQFKHTDEYRISYAVNRRLYHKLEAELRESCADLGFTFLPEQNFHERVLFDKPSSEKLRFMGYHYSEIFSKLALRKQNFLMQCTRQPKVGHTHFFSRVPVDVRGLIAEWTHIAVHQDTPAVPPVDPTCRKM